MTAMGQGWGGSWHGGDWTARIWAPDARKVGLILDDREVPMTGQPDGFWAASVPARVGSRYLFRVDGQDIPDPASRLQSGDVHSPSVVTRPRSPRSGWQGRDWSEAAIYELHLGTFTPEGTLAAAAGRLADLAGLGITAIEIMPVGQFPGTRGWGYDGVLPFALHPAYGSPDDLHDFVDHAHSLGLMVFLDLVMNHFGPEGAYLHLGAPRFFDETRHTPWGAAIDFSQPAVREFWTQCGEYWVGEYGLDGLRLDAVHQITGPGADDFLRQFAPRIRAVDPSRPIHLIVEDERNEPHLRQAGFDAAWNDDFHHAVHVHLTGEADGYYASFADDPFADLCLALERGHVEEGQDRPGRDGPRGQSCGHLPPTAFVNATQTHDQVGNRALGERLLSLAHTDAVRTAYALLLVAPYVPMIFMGEERGATTPFLFCADFSGDLADAIRKGRAAEFAGIATLGAGVPDPLSPDTFARSRLDWSDTSEARDWQDLTRRALRFRSDHVVPLLKSGRSGPASVTRIGPSALQASWPFQTGTLDLWLSLGRAEPGLNAPPDTAFALGRPSQDPFALSATTRSA
ncbi:malto-oligosyltrehalose trehalohydrolase [Paracoccus subflavus]|uniref:Malto-oligosyltrehalose trehalohydrolase n=1 Tax=Paracoccus subflavus TaxID=2528244 RepID=A0A4Q9G3L1_9RHOB|nr:malto-oligosyltrehalose trehalohydrolase [Paracoccus subflavus]TBN41845.1 malto-oligosyltrehalose trehalohydrolase [Paracoccus subflavus]